jgi:hypothetical protein
MKAGRRYCSKECRQYINWVLSLSKGLLKALNARYAAFSFNHENVMLDVFPLWSKDVSRFIFPRVSGNKPAEDLKSLILEFGREWHGLVENRTSKSYASLLLLNRNHKKDMDCDVLKPTSRSSPRLSKQQTAYLKVLQLRRTDLSSTACRTTIKSAYKKMAKVHHPDVGGDSEEFKKLYHAHEQMLLWAENPKYTSRKALEDCWSYDGSTNRWSPPL